MKIKTKFDEITINEDSSLRNFSSQKLLSKCQYAPTKVIFLRNLPASVTEAEITRVVSARYGDVVRVFLLIHKNHAFVEFKNIESAH